MDTTWSSDIEEILNNIRKNCKTLSNYHMRSYLYYKKILQYFRLPVIIISAVNSIVSVGLQPYLEQSMISITTCGLSLISGIVCSIELFYDLQKMVDIEFSQYKQYNLLALDIYKILKLERQHRPLPQSEYLSKIFNEYTRLIESSKLVHNVNDELNEITLLNDVENISTTTNLITNDNTRINLVNHNSDFIELTTITED